MKTVGSIFNLPRRFFEDAYLDTGVDGPTSASIVGVTHTESSAVEAGTGEHLQDLARY